MFDLLKKRHIRNITVAEMVFELAKLDPKAVISVTGARCFWLHVDDKKNVVVIDTDELDDCYESPSTSLEYDPENPF